MPRKRVEGHGQCNDLVFTLGAHRRSGDEKGTEFFHLAAGGGAKQGQWLFFFLAPSCRGGGNEAFLAGIREFSTTTPAFILCGISYLCF